MIGQLLAGRYQVLQVLGAGGFGQTYITEDLHLPGQPKCVLKHLKPASNSPAVLEIARKLFQKEAETLQQLGSHEQIPRLLAFFEEKQEFFLVQEYIIGHTLTAELGTSQKWTESAVHRLLREILTILEFVHGQGVIHRDVKPDNIMRRDNDGKLVLIDFGAIKQVRTQQYPQLGEVTKTISIGTPGYMPLEQAGGTPRSSSDLYALGMICIQALTGQHPTEIAEDDATGELQWQHLVNISPPLLAFLTKITSYHFKDRYVTAHEALQALGQLSSGATYPQPSNSPVRTNEIPSFNSRSPEPTAATWVVAPQSHPSPQPASAPPVNRNFPVSATRPDEPIRHSPGKQWLTGLLILSGAAGLGYFLLRPLVIADQFDTLVETTDRCRIAAPGKNSDFVTKVRDVPDRNAAIKTKLVQGERILFVSNKAEFVQIEQRNGSQGWVFNDQIRSCNAVSPSASPSPEPTTSSIPPASSKPKPQVSKSPSAIQKTLAPTPSPSVSSLDDLLDDPDSSSSPSSGDSGIIPTNIPFPSVPPSATATPSINSPSPSPSTTASSIPSTNPSNSSPESTPIF
jgi:serine/threonine protein kinase